MKKKDVLELQSVIGIYPMAYYFNELLGESYDELPEMIDSSNLRSALKEFISQMEDYQCKARCTFLSVCEDNTD